jgi:hypothetical protein
MAINVAFTERERLALALFFSTTYKPDGKTARRAMRVAFKRMKLDEIMTRLTTKGIKPGDIKDVPVPILINTETLDWMIDKLNKTTSEGSDSLILSEIEDRLEEVKNGSYVMPEGGPSAIVIKMT